MKPHRQSSASAPPGQGTLLLGKPRHHAAATRRLAGESAIAKGHAAVLCPKRKAHAKGQRMRIFKGLIAAGLMVAGLAACENEPGSYADVHTGTRAGHSKMYAANSGLLSNLNAAAIVAHRGGETRYGVGVRYVATGVGWANFSQAWSFGTQLPYAVSRSRVAGCGGGCTIVEEGTIQLSREQFERAAKSGFEFKLVGSGADVVGKLPASAFQEALAAD